MITITTVCVCRSAYRHLNMLFEISISFPVYKPLYWLNATAFFIMLKMYFIWLNCRRWAQESFHVISWMFPSTHIIGFLFKILQRKQVNGTKLLLWAISGQHKSQPLVHSHSYCTACTAGKCLCNIYTATACPDLICAWYMGVNANANGFECSSWKVTLRIGAYLATNPSTVSKRNIWRRMSAGRHSSCALVTGHCSLSM